MSKIGKNFIAILEGNILSKLLTFIFFLIVARYFGEEAFGVANFSNSIITYFLMLSSMGLQNYAIVCIAKSKKNSEVLFNKILTIRAILAIISLVLLIITILISNFIYENKIMTFLYGGMIITNALNIEWYFNAIQEMKYISKSMIIQNVLSLTLLILIVFFDLSQSMYIIPIILVLGNAAGTVYLLYVILKKVKYKFIFSFKESIDFIKHGFPFFFSGVFATINSNLDILLLGIISSNADVGLYSAAYKIINMLIIIVTLVFTPIYPVMIELINLKNWIELNKLMIKIKKYIYIFSFPLLVGGIIMGDEIIVFLFGKQYSNAGNTFKVLVIYISLLYIREIYGYILTASGNQKEYMKIVSISSTINVILNLILIPKIGIIGAAITTLFSEVINLLLMRKISYKNIPLNLKSNSWIKISISVIIMGLFILIMKYMKLNIIINISVSIIIYFIMILKLKVISKEEVLAIKGV